MAAPDTPAETFKRALSHAARALTEQPELEVLFGADGMARCSSSTYVPTPCLTPAFRAGR